MPNWVNIAESTVTAISVVPQLTSANLGQSFSINVTVSDVVDLYAWEIELSWNPSLLGTISVTEGSFLKSGGDTFFIYSWNDTQGHSLIDCTLIGQIVGVSGSGVLATVTFLVLGLGETPLDLHDEVLLDHNETQIACQVSDGYCYLNVSHDVAIVNVEASPMIALIGNSVNINVTVQDVGAFNESFNVTVYAGSQTIGMEPVSLSSGSSANLLFTWDTAGYAKGDYAITASASVLQGEVNIANNYRQTANLLTLLYNGHDIAVTEVEPSKTIVGQGYGAVVKVVVKNYGVFSETSTTAVYANSTIIWLQIDYLTSGSSATLSLVWNTSSFAIGNFSISAFVEPVLDESDIIDNQRISDVPVHTGIPGDISSSIQSTYDGIVNMRDIYYLILLFNTKPSSSNWNPNADVNNDLVVNMRDINIAIMNFNRQE
ncbi:MAG TPA: dockerin type I domain-containing protein [Patescibacteria group bacterium]|nr:dockerin type I domain-containing protein [Patescibacteria group bacterium]